MKKLVWLGSSKKDLDSLPHEIQQAFGYGLYLAQMGEKHQNGKPLKGFGSANIIELVEKDHVGTYRAVYTIQVKNAIFVVHVFQKKSKHGIATPKQDVELIKNRLKLITNIL